MGNDGTTLTQEGKKNLVGRDEKPRRVDKTRKSGDLQSWQLGFL
jgi:hypothetical protein